MNKPVSAQFPHLQQYVNTRDRAGRLALLATMKACDEKIPIDFVEDMLCLDLSAAEKAGLVELLYSRDPLALEHFLLSHTAIWHQDLASTALRYWADQTDCLLWYRLLPLLELPHLPQRVRYTILDLCWRSGGEEILQKIAETEGLEDLSKAFHGLLFQRAVQWTFRHSKLDGLAVRKVALVASEQLPEDKSTAAALIYLARFIPESLATLIPPVSGSSPWLDVIKATCDHLSDSEKHLDKLSKFLQKVPKSKPLEKLAVAWPPLWQRHALTAEHLARALEIACADPVLSRLERHRKSALAPTPPALLEFFAGTNSEHLSAALQSLGNEEIFLTGVRGLRPLLSSVADKALFTHVETRLAQSPSSDVFLRKLDPRYRLLINAKNAKSDADHANISKLLNEEQGIRAKTTATAALKFVAFHDGVEPAWGSSELGDHAERKRFFDAAFRGRPSAGDDPKQHGFWTQLVRAWTSPTEQALGELAGLARQIPGVFRIPYLNTLGRFKGIDPAALKLLDFIRASEEDELRAVVRALAGIGTQRAILELIAAMTRPNVTTALQLEITQLLKDHDVTHLQPELRSALKDLKARAKTEEERSELRDALSELIIPMAEVALEKPAGKASASKRSPAATALANDQDLDAILGGKVPHYKDLSSEVKRALRTAQFFHLQVKTEGAPDSIDLSPVIDMQYKALELLFREMFEEPCSDLIHKGQLQRRLDVIGYARPIPHQMDEFENFISSLPTVKDIPFFSKFKLRKMLRAICQFRPGKRFTLDGLKAFALFFLCFGRQQCRYGLQGLCHLGFASDTELAGFCKTLHIFQDFRNRAAHEGFHPDASNDIDGIWQNTAEIVQMSFKVKAALDQAAPESEYAPKNRSTPIIQRKVS